MEVRPDHPPELPDELERLGVRLEAATAAQLARRRRYRTSLLNGAGAVLVGIPLALAIATTDVAPSARPVAELVRTQGAAAGPSSMVSARFVLNQVPDGADAARGTPCVMVPDCRPVTALP